ncbi:MAG: alcohol dehydrogenase catalytic domain-containing protein [Rhodocyclaceae bacterium]|jgi:2-desacetyl-2-hydroxyethyl bacteriochlorophyllide A dehydrogenase|nr:alcohol dehydrogenase catalytic domain-containing protein [Rhodocyclaceae bacterium]
MAKMKSAVMLGPRQIELVDVDVPQVDADSVIIKTEGIGVCGSNLHWWRGAERPTSLWPFPIPGAGGHEYGGTVVEVGRNIRRLKVGDRVAVDQFHSTSCGHCVYCTSGAFGVCPNRGNFVTPGFVEYIKFGEKGMHVLPDSIATHDAAIIEPAATPIGALRRLGLRGGERVVVLGAGVVGLIAANVAKLLGAGKVVVTAKYDQQEKFAYEFGADAVVRSSSADTVEQVLAQVDGGADIVIETVGGSANTLDLAAAIVRPRGTVVVLGLWEVATKIDSWAAVFKEINFMYALAYGQVGLRTDYEFAIDMMASGRLPLQKLITHQLPLANIREAFELADDKTRGAIKVLVRP